MSDREKVISTLEDIKKQTAEIGLDSAVIAHKFIDKILALLKEQEAVRPEPIMGTSVCDCGKCKHAVAPGMNYCPSCGCQINWN